MNYHPKKTHWVKRCWICNKILACWNKSGLCSRCRAEVYKKSKKGGMEQDDNKN